MSPNDGTPSERRADGLTILGRPVVDGGAGALADALAGVDGPVIVDLRTARALDAAAVGALLEARRRLGDGRVGIAVTPGSLVARRVEQAPLAGLIRVGDDPEALAAQLAAPGRSA